MQREGRKGVDRRPFAHYIHPAIAICRESETHRVGYRQSLGNGVTVAQQTLTLFVLVRIQVPQPTSKTATICGFLSPDTSLRQLWASGLRKSASLSPLQSVSPRDKAAEKTVPFLFKKGTLSFGRLWSVNCEPARMCA